MKPKNSAIREKIRRRLRTGEPVSVLVKGSAVRLSRNFCTLGVPEHIDRDEDDLFLTKSEAQQQGYESGFAYIAREGDSLKTIAKRCGTTVEALIIENNLTAEQAKKIEAGQMLIVPETSCE